MTGTLPQSGPFKEFTEEVKELSSQFFQARESCAAESLRLLHTNQRFLKKLEDLKNTKKELNSRRNNYVDQTTVFALRDAELRYQKACMLDTEKEWAAMIANRHEEIKSFRAELESHLQHYCDERRKTAAVQTKVTNRTEEDRINSLNSVAFCTYAQTMVDGEVKKLCAAAGLPTTRNIQRMQRIANQAIRASQQDLQDFYAEKIKEFKRQERILYGRGRDAVDTSPRSLLRADNESNTTGNNTSNAYSSTAAGNGSSSSDITTDMLVDTLENRIATKLVSSTLESLRNTDDEGGNEGSNRFMRMSNFNPAPPLSSPSGKMTSSGNYPNSATSARRNITSSGKPSKGGGEEASSPLRASTLQQHQQRLLSLQQQHPQRGAALGNQGVESRGNRRFSLLQNGDLIPAVSACITGEVTKSGKARGPQANVPALASATVGDQLAGTNNKTGPANSAMAATISNAKTANVSSHVTSKQKKKNKRRKSTDGEGDNVVFDPNRYIPACSVDFVKPHTLLDLTSPTIADREEKLLTLANLSCEVRGRVTQMTFLRDALDGLLMQQIACLLTALTHNQPMPLPLSSPGGQMLLHATQQPAQALIDQHLLVPRSASVDEDPAAVLLRNPEDALAAAAAVLDGSANLPLVNDDDDDASATAFHQYAADPGKKKALTQFKKQPLRLSAAHKIIQLDCAQKEQDIHILRDRIALLLQRPPDSPPATARRPKGNLANNQPESL